MIRTPDQIFGSKEAIPVIQKPEPNSPAKGGVYVGRRFARLRAKGARIKTAIKHRMHQSKTAAPKSYANEPVEKWSTWDKRGLYIFTFGGSLIGAGASLFVLDRIMRAPQYFETVADTAHTAATEQYAVYEEAMEPLGYNASSPVVTYNQIPFCQKVADRFGGMENAPEPVQRQCEFTVEFMQGVAQDMGHLRTVAAETAPDVEGRGMTADTMNDVVTGMYTTFNYLDPNYYAAAAGGGFIGGVAGAKTYKGLRQIALGVNAWFQQKLGTSPAQQTEPVTVTRRPIRARPARSSSKSQAG